MIWNLSSYSWTVREQFREHENSSNPVLCLNNSQKNHKGTLETYNDITAEE